ncbi:carbohydrate sulfotransferase 11 isoform X2 [Cryptotermes secundus]|uniref:carbohydrate sulfotransferase 11 isoform X2 n=1 Tax=Cryptotermes secundus TaxID=105785 RepID=UPI000CD7C4A5|nr:carbohydrate sulfotransferase 11 isoform X2 [Cryptotermes secundus]
MRPPRYCRFLRRCVFLVVGITIVPAVFMILAGSEAGVGRLHHQSASQHKNDSWSHEAMSYWMSEVEARMVQRRHHLKQTCTMLGLDVSGNDSLHRPNPWEFLVNRPYHLVWCNVFKAASTSWMYNFNILAGYNSKFLKNSKLVPLNLARRRYPRPSLHALQQALHDSIAFLIVRHPLERLLSAYRDKIQFSLPHTLHQKLGNEIILKYRKNKQKAKGPGNKSTPKNPRWPTFSEFVQYLVNIQQKGDPFDMHWTPITHFCTPCQVDFDIILKFETLQEDQNYLIHQAGLQDVIRPEWKNPAKGRTTTELVTSYYSQLTTAQIFQLYHIYRYDFELFGYTLDGYLELGMTESNSPDTPPT